MITSKGSFLFNGNLAVWERTIHHFNDLPVMINLNRLRSEAMTYVSSLIKSKVIFSYSAICWKNA